MRWFRSCVQSNVHVILWPWFFPGWQHDDWLNSLWCSVGSRLWLEEHCIPGCFHWLCPLLQVLSFISKALSFLWQILPNSAGQFAKFHGSRRQYYSNFMACHHHVFVSKLSSILSKKLKLLNAGVVLGYASNIQRKLSIFLKCNLSSQIVFIYDCVPYCDGY